MQKDKKLLMKYYLRGVGTGLAAAVLLLGLSGVNQKVEALERQKDNPKATESFSSGQGSENTVVESGTSYETTDGTEPEGTIETSESNATIETSESNSTTESSESNSTTESSESGATTETSESDSTTETSESMEHSSDSTEATESTETSTSESTEASQQGGQVAQDGDYVLTIYRGYSSWTVAKILAQESIVDDAKAFDDYLCRNGYDKRIRVGSFVIPEGSDEATIAKIITGDL